MLLTNAKMLYMKKNRKIDCKMRVLSNAKTKLISKLN